MKNLMPDHALTTLKVQWASPIPSLLNRDMKRMRKELKCSWWRLHFLKTIPIDSELYFVAKEKTVQHHKVSIKKFSEF